MSFSERSDTPIADLLSAVTDAMMAGDDNLDAVVRRYHVPRAEIEGLIAVIQRLHVALVGVQPSRRFVRRLKHDLVGTSSRNIIDRVRYLPPRVQIVAGIALIAGFILFNRRRLLVEARENPASEVVA